MGIVIRSAYHFGYIISALDEIGICSIALGIIPFFIVSSLRSLLPETTLIMAVCFRSEWPDDSALFTRSEYLPSTASLHLGSHQRFQWSITEPSHDDNYAFKLENVYSASDHGASLV